MSEEEQKEGLKIRRCIGLTNEFRNEYNHVINIVNDVALKYLDTDNYELFVEDWVDTLHVGTVEEYNILYFEIYAKRKGTERKVWLGHVDYADNCLCHVTKEEKRNDYFVFYSDDNVRKQVEEIFQDRQKEEESDEEE